MTKLRLAPDLAVPEDVVTSTVVVYGGKGMGKTNFGSVLIEELTKAKLRWCLLDPMGVGWGLRHSKDGKGPGIECVILGGAHGDIPIEPTGGAIVADLVIDENANVIIDFSRRATGKMWSKGERIRFVTDYATRLFERQGELVGGRRREPLMQILDEAARYIPQTIPANSPVLAECVGAWEQVCEEGRNIGLGVTFLTQRSARMNKSVSELADVMIAFRTVGPNSLAAIMDWLGEHVEKARIRDLAAQVRELNIGHALVVSPGWLRLEKVVHIRERETFDSSATPKPGQRAQKVSGDAAKPDLAKYQAKMAATIEKAKADDPRVLRKEIAALRRQVEQKPSAKGQTDVEVRQHLARAVKFETRHLQVRLDRVVSAFRRYIDMVERHSKSAVKATGKLGGQSEQMRAALTEWESGASEAERTEAARTVVSPGEVGPSRQVVGRISQAPARPITALSEPMEGDRPAGQQKLLDAAARLRAVNVETPTRAQVAALAPMSPTSSATERHFAGLLKDGLFEIPEAGRVRLTAVGVAAAAHVDQAPTLDEYLDAWRGLLSGGEVKLFDAMTHYAMGAVSRAELAEAAGVSATSSATERSFAWLISLDLFAVAGKGLVKAGPTMYPEGL